MQQVLAVHMKWAKDECVEIKKKISMLDSSITVETDKQTEIEAQEEHAQQMLDTNFKDLQKANKIFFSVADQGKGKYHSCFSYFVLD